MTPIEARDACKALAGEIGVRAEITILLGSKDRNAACCFMVEPTPWPNDRDRFYVYDNTFEGGLAGVRAEWAKRANEYDAAIVRRMALAIIDKADGGQVTDRALMADFSAGEVAKYGDAACAEATRLAGNAPFSIVKDGAPALSVA